MLVYARAENTANTADTALRELREIGAGICGSSSCETLSTFISNVLRNILESFCGSAGIAGKVILGNFLLASYLLGAITPATCSSHPCTFNHTCNNATCSTSEVQEIRDLLASSTLQSGDTIKLQAGKIYQLSPTLRWRIRKSGINITTSADSDLPSRSAGQVRITPHYASKMPIIRSTGGYTIIVDCKPPANDITFRGLTFDQLDYTPTSINLAIGCNYSADQPLYPYDNYNIPTEDSDLPDNITVEHCLFRNRDWLSNAQDSYMLVSSRRAYIRNNWISGARNGNSEKQSMQIYSGPGPVHVDNTYIGDIGGQNIMHGGVGPAYDVATQGRMVLNSFVNHPERMMGKMPGSFNWSASTDVFKGRFVRPGPPPNTCWYQAETSGTTGSGPNPLPTTCPSSTVNDNGIIWRPKGTAIQLVMKALYESKTSHHQYSAFNLFRGFTNNQQHQPVIYKYSNYPPNNSYHGQCTFYMTGRVNTNGVDVVSADGQPLPENQQPFHVDDPTPRAININGVVYQVADFLWQDPQRLRLQTSAGVQSNVAYRYGRANLRSPAGYGGPCIASWNLNNDFVSNIVEDSPVAMTIAQFNNGSLPRLGNLRVVDNLFRRLDCSLWGGCTSATSVVVPGLFAIQHMMPGYMIENNTVVDAGAVGSGVSMLYYNAPQKSDIQTRGALKRVRGNFFQRASGMAGIKGIQPNTADGSATLSSHMCNDGPCGPEAWSHNVMTGTDLNQYTETGPTYNLCSGNSSCTPATSQYEALFQDWTNRTLQVKPSSFAWHARENGSSIGANYMMLPLIRHPDTSVEGPKITTTETEAIFSYWVHPPLIMHQLSCSLEVSTTKDMDTLVNVAIPNSLADNYGHATYPTGALRSIRASGLTGNTTYYYRLHCGPIWEGSFTTAAGAVACPAPPQVNLSQTAIIQGQNSIATPPAGWSAGSFVSSNTSVAVTSNQLANRIAALVTGVTAGSVSITGTGWRAPNGAVNCNLAGRNLTVSATTQRELLVYDWNQSVQSRSPSTYAERTPPSAFQPQVPRNNFDWTATPNYAGGTYYVRVKLGCMTANDQFRLNFNHWQGVGNSATQAETNIPANTAGMNFNFTGTAITNTFTAPISTFDLYSPGSAVWSWAKLRDRVGFFSYPLAVYGGDSDPPQSVVLNDDVYPYDLRVTAVVVAPGGTFSGWSYWQNHGWGERTYDCAFPTPVTITAPTNGATVSGTTNINVSATDNVGVTMVEYLIDGVTAFKDAVAPYQYAWDTNGVTTGDHTIVARAWDAAGNSNTSSTITVTK